MTRTREDVVEGERWMRRDVEEPKAGGGGKGKKGGFIEYNDRRTPQAAAASADVSCPISIHVL